MKDPCPPSWDRPVRQVKSLPGQRLLFGPERAPQGHRDSSPVAVPEGQCWLFDAGHGLPGAGETDQRILWDIE